MGTGESRRGEGNAVTPIEQVNQIAVHLRTFRLRFGTEADLQEDVWMALDGESDDNLDSGDLMPEYNLGAAGRIDFYFQSGIGVECKVQGNKAAVLSQLLRYADHPLITGLVLVTRCRQHTNFPDTLRGKPLAIVWVAGVL